MISDISVSSRITMSIPRTCLIPLCESPAVMGYSEMPHPLFCLEHTDAGCVCYGERSDPDPLKFPIRIKKIRRNLCCIKKCKQLGVFASSKWGKSYCYVHAEDGMSRHYHVMCRHPYCSKIAEYNYVGADVKFCSDHRESGMTRIEVPYVEFIRMMSTPVDHKIQDASILHSANYDILTDV